jgi:hypothetical protein
MLNVNKQCLNKRLLSGEIGKYIKIKLIFESIQLHINLKILHEFFLENNFIGKSKNIIGKICFRHILLMIILNLNLNIVNKVY